MDCDILPLDNSACPATDGGIYESRATKASNVTAVTLDVDGQVTNFTMSTTGLWEKWIYDDDDTANYLETGTRTNNKHVYDQAAFLKYSGLDNAKRKHREGLTPCCALIVVHYLNNGKAVVQGIENQATLNSWKLARKRAKATVTVNTDTNAGEDRMEVTITSQGRQSSPYTTLTAAALDAL